MIKIVERKFKDIRDMFIELGSEYSWFNTLPLKFAFYVVAGRLLVNCTLRKGQNITEPRIWLLWVQQTGTGKTKLFHFIKRILQELDLTVEVPKDFSDKTLMGHVEKTAKKNIRHKGALESDFLYFEDNVAVFKENAPSYQSNSKAFIRGAYDSYPFNEQERPFGAEKIRVTSKSGIIISTPYTENPDVVFDETGTAQRFIVLPRFVSDETRLQIAVKDNDMLHVDGKSYTGSDKLYQDSFKDLCETLDGLSSKMDEVVYTEEALNYRKQFSEQLMRQFLASNDYVKAKGMNYYPRLLSMLDKMSMQIALIEGRNKIETDDMFIAEQDIMEFLELVITWWENHQILGDAKTQKTINADKAFQVFANILENEKTEEGFLLQTELIRLVANSSGLSTNTVTQTYWPKVKHKFDVGKMGRANIVKFYEEEMV